MDKILLLSGTPAFRQESIAASYYLRIKISGQFWPILRQTTYTQIAAKERRCKVNVLQRSMN